MSKSLKELSNIVEKFCVERNWENSNPNQLLTSTFIELGELSEHYQWQNEFKKLTEDEKKEIGFEFVDVLFYLIRLANKSDIDIEKYFLEKIPKLGKKFPVGQSSNYYKKIHKEYRENGRSKKYED